MPADNTPNGWADMVDSFQAQRLQERHLRRHHLDGLRAAHPDVTFSAAAGEPVPRDAVDVVVVGETPYAEGFGDVDGPRWGWDPADGGVQRPAQTMMLNDAGLPLSGGRDLRSPDDPGAVIARTR